MLWGIRVQGRERDAVVVWAGSEEAEQDRVLTVQGAGGRVLPVFRNEGQASRFLRGRGERLAARGPAFVGLAQVERWLKGPAERGIEAGWVLEAWNFLEDLARGLDAWQQLPAQGAVHNSAYDKLFGDEIATWTPEERAAVRELLTAGVTMWNSCVTARAGRLRRMGR
ncbi:hypothetical protein ACEZCY_25195 [Streptacidiphilus sp. N1-12]|uniref:Uncharacterized protein n=2 Tax=Streptacidiphilus alkalitolerans TaxID=3342712 RepID=A0ABV6WKB9_9ACTN